MRKLPMLGVIAGALGTAAFAVPPLPGPEARVAEMARPVDGAQMRRTVQALVSLQAPAGELIQPPPVTKPALGS